MKSFDQAEMRSCLNDRQAMRLPYNYFATLPGAALPALCVLRSASMKMKSSGGAAQIKT